MTIDSINIITKYYGTNFTGATLSTHQLAQKWANENIVINIYTLNIGEHKKEKNINIYLCKSNKDIISELKKIITNNTVFYSDDHLAYLLKIANKSYFHTYHGNWPNARWISFEYFIKSFYFLPLYKTAIKNAVVEIAVSEKYKKDFISKYTNNCCVIRNGLGEMQNSYNNNNDMDFDGLKIIMVGNIDKRKYNKALKIFQELGKLKISCTIDIYGKIIDKKLFNKLIKYDFVKYKGFQSKINYSEYNLFLSTSTNENLPISCCEALKMKIPIICFNTGAMNEIVINNDNGFIIEDYNISEMLRILIAFSKREIHLEFNNKVIHEYDWDIASKKYLKLFKDRVGN